MVGCELEEVMSKAQREKLTWLILSYGNTFRVERNEEYEKEIIQSVTQATWKKRILSSLCY